MPSWVEQQATLVDVARRQLFFVGGAPRSGTTWVQQILDSHPDVSCRGEGLFQKHLAEPMQALMVKRQEALEAKNTWLFSHTGGYPLPEPTHTELLIGTEILLALSQQLGQRTCAAVGEKTPENVFFFPRLKRLFPGAKFIGVARDPRDILASAWHIFRQSAQGGDDVAAKAAYVDLALPSIGRGLQAMIEMEQRHPNDCALVTYEDLHRAPGSIVARLFEFLGVSSSPDLVASCIQRNSFEAMTQAQAPDGKPSASFLRKGLVGDWGSTFNTDIGDKVVADLGWAFPYFGWRV